MAESRSISFDSRALKADDVSNILDRDFKEFGQKKVEESRTVEQFFEDYDKLFFEIPIEGETGSHKYLVEQSSQLYELKDNLMDIQPLLDEITQLRSQSIQDQQTIVDLRLKLAGASETGI